MFENDSLPPLREVIARHNLRADKKLGQNFLLDANITDKIARAAGELSDVHVIEIGPGPGGLTRSLLRTGAASVTAVEFDPRAVGALHELESTAQERLRVVQGDALSLDVRTLTPDGKPRMIVANLPYNIATPLLIGWLQHIRIDSHFVRSMTLMFQREVADRLTAAPATKAYGRLSVMAQWLCETRRLFDLPPSVFVPPPKITSSVVQFTPRTLPPESPSFETMEKIVAAAFHHRRKMLRAGMKGYAPALTAAGIDDTLRAENLHIDDFVRLALAQKALS